MTQSRKNSEDGDVLDLLVDRLKEHQAIISQKGRTSAKVEALYQMFDEMAQYTEHKIGRNVHAWLTSLVADERLGPLPPTDDVRKFFDTMDGFVKQQLHDVDDLVTQSVGCHAHNDGSVHDWTHQLLDKIPKDDQHTRERVQEAMKAAWKHVNNECDISFGRYPIMRYATGCLGRALGKERISQFGTGWASKAVTDTPVSWAKIAWKLESMVATGRLEGGDVVGSNQDLEFRLAVDEFASLKLPRFVFDLTTLKADLRAKVQTSNQLLAKVLAGMVTFGISASNLALHKWISEGSDA